MAKVTNLFRSLPGEAQCSYAYYLSRLAINDRHRRVARHVGAFADTRLPSTDPPR